MAENYESCDKQHTIEGELTPHEIEYFKAEIERLRQDFTPLSRMQVQVTDDKHLAIGPYESAPGVEIHETIAESYVYRAYTIGEWRTVRCYPMEPDFDDLEWPSEDATFRGDAVIPEIMQREVSKYVPEYPQDHAKRRPVHVVVKSKHLTGG